LPWTEFWVFQGEPVKIKVWFTPDIADHIKEEVSHEGQKVETLYDGSIIFESEVAGSDKIKRPSTSFDAEGLYLRG